MHTCSYVATDIHIKDTDKDNEKNKPHGSVSIKASYIHN